MPNQKRQDGLLDILLFKNGKYLHPRTNIGRVEIENGYYFKPSSRFFQFTK